MRKLLNKMLLRVARAALRSKFPYSFAPVSRNRRAKRDHSKLPSRPDQGK